MARYFECPIQCFSAAFDVWIKISESYRPQIPTPTSSVNLYVSFLYQDYFEIFSEISLTIIYRNRIEE